MANVTSKCSDFDFATTDAMHSHLEIEHRYEVTTFKLRTELKELHRDLIEKERIDARNARRAK